MFPIFIFNVNLLFQKRQSHLKLEYFLSTGLMLVISSLKVLFPHFEGLSDENCLQGCDIHDYNLIRPSLPPPNQRRISVLLLPDPDACPPSSSSPPIHLGFLTIS